MNQVPAYRITAEDLPDADEKTKRAIQPLIDRLNRSLTAVIATVNSLQIPTKKVGSFTTDSFGVASVNIVLPAPPAELWCSALSMGGAIVVASYAFSWIPNARGAQLLFVGLGSSSTFDFSVRYL